MCGPSSSSNSSSAASNQTTVNTTDNVNFAVDTSDLANAITALASAEGQGATLNAAAQVYTAQVNAASNVAAAEADAGPSWSTIIYVVAALVGVAYTMGLFRVPRSLGG